MQTRVFWKQDRTTRAQIGNPTYCHLAQLAERLCPAGRRSWFESKGDSGGQSEGIRAGSRLALGRFATAYTMDFVHHGNAAPRFFSEIRLLILVD